MSIVSLRKKHPIFTACSDMVEICEPLFKALDINYFAHTIYYRKTSAATGLITQSDVATHWLMHQYSMPGSNKNSGELASGFYLADYMGEAYPLEYRLAMKNLFNIEHMLMHIKASPKCYEFLTFGARPENDAIVNTYLNNLDLLSNFLTYYQEKANTLIKKSLNILVPLPRLTVVSKKLTPIYYDNNPNNFTSTLKTITHNELKLSKRESECLAYLAMGKLLC